MMWSPLCVTYFGRKKLSNFTQTRCLNSSTTNCSYLWPQSDDLEMSDFRYHRCSFLLFQHFFSVLSSWNFHPKLFFAHFLIFFALRAKRNSSFCKITSASVLKLFSFSTKEIFLSRVSRKQTHQQDQSYFFFWSWKDEQIQKSAFLNFWGYILSLKISDWTSKLQYNLNSN